MPEATLDSPKENEVQAGAESGAAAAEGEGAQGQTSAADTSQAHATEGDPSLPGEEGEKPAYKAREKFKYRVFDPALKDSDEKLQKEEAVPDWLKPLITDEKSEKQVMELLEKAYGLDPVKSERAHVRKERDEARIQMGGFLNQVKDLRETFQKGDIDLWLNKLQIPEERMLQWALEKVNYSKLDPEQQRLYDDRRDAQRKAWSSEKTLASTQEQLHEQVRNAKQIQLQSSLSRPDIKSFSDQFNERAGRPDAFMDEVRATGHLAWTQSNGKEDLSPDQAIDRVMQKWSKFLPAKTAQAPSASAAGSQGGGGGSQADPNAAPNVIPNVSGRSSSPLKTKVRSLDDLKKLAAQVRN